MSNIYTEKIVRPTFAPSLKIFRFSVNLSNFIQSSVLTFISDPGALGGSGAPRAPGIPGTPGAPDALEVRVLGAPGP